MIHDLRFAVRSLFKNPGPSAVAVLILGLGIGANTVVFSLVYGLALRPLGYEDPESLVRVFGTEPARGRDRQRVTEATVRALREHGTGFETVAGARNTGLSVTDSDRPLNPLMRQVTEGWFDMLGVEAALGRTFTLEENRTGAKVVVLEHRFWQSQLGGDPEIVGKTIELGYEDYEIVGVLPSYFQNEAFPQLPVLWLPWQDSAAPQTVRSFVMIGRLADAATLAQAQSEVDRVSAELARLYPESHSALGMRVASLHDSLIERFEPALMVLFAAVGFVLLIACSNVANILLTRALGRRAEIAVRQALGAGRRHLARQLLSESLLISLAAAGLGVLAAFWAIGPLTRMAPSNVSVPMLDKVQVEPAVLTFSLALAGLTTLLFGMMPLRQLFRSSASVLSAGALRATSGRSRRRIRSTLVVTELALSMVLLVGAGLTVRSLQHLRGIELGFEADGLLVGRVGARGPGYTTQDRWEPFHREVSERVAALPGVAAVGGIEFLPTFAASFGASTPIAPQGTDLPPESRPRAVSMSLLPGYFAAAGHPLASGRDFSPHDDADGEPVAVISGHLARRLWGDEDPLDRMLVVGEGESQVTVRLIGVAGDLRGLADNPASPPILFRPMAQRPTSNVSLYVRRASSDEQALLAMVPQIEDAVWSLTRDAPVYGFSTMAQMMRDLEWQPRFLVQLLSGFALLALFLAATGVYSVLAYAVSERRREIGIRVTVGASRGDILRMVGREALLLSAIGVGLGIFGALAASRGLESQLLGVSARDPWTYGLLAVGLTSVAMLASYLPALRATRFDPVIALRSE